MSADTETKTEIRLAHTQLTTDIGGAWAGGALGMEVTDRLLQLVPVSPPLPTMSQLTLQDLLSAHGRFYLVAIEQNKPDAIIAANSTTLHGRVSDASLDNIAKQHRSYSGAGPVANTYPYCVLRSRMYESISYAVSSVALLPRWAF